jgi:phosphoglycerol transferase MdoB-like AlkP superfamily enzyme
MEYNHNAYASELSGNGLFTLTAAAGRNGLDYLKFYRTLPPQTASSVLAQLGVVHPLKSSVRRAEYEHDQAASNELFLRTPKNLVLVSVESLSASFLDSYGANKELTPNLDALARGGLKFDNVYATGTRTVRGLEALSLGTPPVPLSGNTVAVNPEASA